MRRLLPLVLFFSACSPQATPPHASAIAPVNDPAYRQSVDELSALNRRAGDLVKSGKPDAAADLMVKGEELSKRLLAAPRPTLAAVEAASDLDELYGRMLLTNHNAGWARLMFQKNVVRWKYWKPETPETAARLKRAQEDIAECDRRIAPPK